MEPSQADIAAVSQALGEQPAQQQPAPVTPQPAPSQQPAEPVQQPAPAQPQQPTQPTEPTDPFASIFGAEPAAPAPQQPTQPTEPTPQQPITPTEPQPAPVAQPAPAPAVPQQEEFMSLDDYMKSVTSGVGEAPGIPDATKIDPNDEAGIKGFFDDLVRTAKEQALVEMRRGNAIQTSECQLWDAAFDKYGSLRTNKPLRDMVHSIRMGEFQKGIAITPTQAADRLLTALKAQYNQGIADNQVVTTIESVQPTGGNGTPVATTMDTDKALLAVQTGGEQALAQILDAQIKAGQR